MSLFKSAGHLFLAGIFISGGSDTFLHPDGRATKVEAAGIPQPRQAAILNGALMVVAGALLGLDILPKTSSLLLIGSMIPTTFVGHPFWKEETPTGKAGQRIHFLKNVAIIGGLLSVLNEK